MLSLSLWTFLMNLKNSNKDHVNSNIIISNSNNKCFQEVAADLNMYYLYLLAIIKVRELPPRLSFSNHVNFESLYGINTFFSMSVSEDFATNKIFVIRTLSKKEFRHKCLGGSQDEFWYTSLHTLPNLLHRFIGPNMSSLTMYMGVLWPITLLELWVFPSKWMLRIKNKNKGKTKQNQIKQNIKKLACY